MKPPTYFGGLSAPLILLALYLLVTPGTAQKIEGWPDEDDRFLIFEACHFKYGFIPIDPDHGPPPPPKYPGKPEHNVGLEECHRTYYRQTFCRNQRAVNANQQFQRICKVLNPHHLKFFAMVFGLIWMGALVRTVIRNLKLALPYTVTLMVIGMGIGGLSNISNFCVRWTPYTRVARTPPDILLNVFLPVLIFESSFAMKAHLFFKSIFSILVLALPGMLISTFLTACLCQQFFFSYNWTFIEACLFGCIISATDPVAVVSILKEVGTSETLSCLVDGESLLNDGVAILLFEVFSEMIEEENLQLQVGEHDGKSPGLKIFIMFIRITLGGPAWGWLTARAVIWYLSKIFNDPAVEVSITLCAAYLTYYVGETYLGVSGVMALVLLGITLSAERTCISPEVQGLVHHFWEMLCYLANTVLFVILGIVITETAATSFKPEDGYYLIFLYFALNIIRLLMIGILSPLLSRIGYGLSWQNMVVMTWGGLRGAVGVCLALQVYKDKTICQKETVGPKILLQTAGIVLMTLLINGTTTKTLLDMLKLTELSIGKIQDMANAVKQIQLTQQKTLSVLRHDRFLADANWAIVEECTEMSNPYLQRNIKAREEEEAKKKISLIADFMPDEGPKAECPHCDTEMAAEPGGERLREMTEEARLRILKTMKVSCWRQYEQGVLTEPAVLVLQDCWEKLEDKKYSTLNHKDFDRYWEIGGFWEKIRKWLGSHFNNNGEFGDEDIPLPEQPWRHIYHRIAISITFSVFIYMVVIANFGITFWEASHLIDLTHKLTENEYIMFYLLNIGFTLIYLAEFFIKVSGMGFGEYMNSKWNIMDCILLIIGLIEVILSGTYLREEIANASDSGIVHHNQSSQEGDFLKFVRFIRILRIIRIFRFIKPIMPLVIGYVNDRVNKKLFLAYDLGKGFITAVDDVQKFLPQIVEQPRILLKFKALLQFQRTEIIREMGLLQKEHPGIATAVKTRHASRAILNHLKEELSSMKEDGLIDEKEFDSLMEEVEHKMKGLWNSPSYMKPTSAETVLANTSWMAVTYGSKELFEFIYRRSTVLQYNFGDVIYKEGDETNGIHIIVMGLVRVRYDPTFEMSVEREDFGILPNSELFQDLSYENEMEDYFSTGTAIGELGALTGMPRGASVVCETPVSVYHIPQSVIQEAIKSFNDNYDSLEARLWRTVGIKIATSLLPHDENYTNWSMERIKAYLERSAVPMQDQFNQMIIPEFIGDAIVIYGQVVSVTEPEEVFTAPCLIPRTIRHVKSKPGARVNAQVLVIAEEDEDLWNSDEYSSDEEEPETKAPAEHVGETSLHRIIYTGSRGNSLTEEEIMQIQLQRQSRTVNYDAGDKSKTKMGTPVRVQNKGKV